MPPLKHFRPGNEPARELQQLTEITPDVSDLLGKPLFPGTGNTEAFYPISALAHALNRSTGTIRTWHETGVLPGTYSVPGKTPNGRRRVYTARQIMGLRRLAAEYGVLDDKKAQLEEFSKRARMLFEQLMEAA